MGKEIDIEYEGKPAKVTIRRMGWAEKNSFAEKYNEIKVVNDKPEIISHIFEMRTARLQVCLVKAPFNKDATALNEQDPEMLEKIYEEIEKFDKIDKEIKKKLREHSSEQEKEKTST